MKCDQIRTAILTDYLDNESSQAQLEEIKVHTETCCACKNYLDSLDTAIKYPFSNAANEMVPEGIWENVKQSITSRNMGSALAPEPKLLFREKSQLYRFLGIAASLFVVGGMALVFHSQKENRPMDAKLTVSQQNEALVFLTDEYMDFTSDESNDEEFYEDEGYL